MADKDPEKVANAYKGVVNQLKEQLENKGSKWLSRKLVLSLLVIVLGFVLTLLGKVDGMEYLLFVCGVTGIYTAGNVMQKATSKEITG